jgi:predicted PurR-regulated permease PerM
LATQKANQSGGHAGQENRQVAQTTRLAIPLWILAVIATALFLRETRGFFVPIALAMLASYAVYPVASRIDRLGVPRVLSAAIVVGVVVGLAGLGTWTLRDNFARSVRELPEQVRQIRAELQRSATGGTLERLREAAREMQKTGTAVAGGGGSAGGDSGQDAGGQAAPPGAAGQGPPSGLSQYLWQGSTGLMTVAGQLTVIVFLVYFLLLGAESWRARLIQLSGTMLSSRRTGAEVIDEINHQVQRFLLVRVITSVVVGTATWLALLAFGAPSPGLWAVGAAVFNWVPYFGPIIVSGGLAIVGFVSGGVTMALELALVALVITSLEGWVLTPPLLGRAAQMNTLAVFLSLLFWSWVWGIWGTILAMPLMSILKAVSDHVEQLHWLSRLLADDAGA